MIRLITLSVIFTVCFSQADIFAKGRLDSIYRVLDKALDNRDAYETKRLARIEVLSIQNRVLDSLSLECYDTNLRLFREYKQYRCDSAITYLNRNLSIAEHLKDPDRIHETKLLLSSYLEMSGYYKESVDILESIDRNDVAPKRLLDYYYYYWQVYSSLVTYTKDRKLSIRYKENADRYSDSLFAYINETDRYTDRQEFVHIIRETGYQAEGLFDEALKINDLRLATTAEGTPEYALTTYYRAVSYGGLGDREMEKYYFALSSITDIESAIKDYASLWMLAEILYNEGDIDRADRYIRAAWDDIQFYDARLRRLQTSGLKAFIDWTSRMQLQKENEEMRLYIVFVSILVVMLAAALFFIHRQMKKLAAVGSELKGMNGMLKELNKELTQANNSLRYSNDMLLESNTIKEKYIGHFMNMCSVYIDKLDAYRRMIHKKVRDRKIGDLLQITVSREGIDADMKKLYMDFDTTFLQLFPDFVSEFNKLLRDNEVIELKDKEALNTELRIYALIRLGIDDSARIAEFLRYSLNTIYNYRAKMRNKAKVSRDEFEDMVKRIR